MANAAERILVIIVVRTGGFAGLTREWRTEARDEDDWLPLIEACPWRQVPPADQLSRDRFVWRIEVKAPDLRRKATLPDSALDGPWRTLVQRVQETAETER